MPTVLMRVFFEVRIHRRSLFFPHVNCRRITGSGNSKCPLPADISVRVRRFPSSHSFASVATVHLERQRGSIVVFSLSVYNTKWYIFKDNCKVKIITVLSHKAPR